MKRYQNKKTGEVVYFCENELSDYKKAKVKAVNCYKKTKFVVIPSDFVEYCY